MSNSAYVVSLVTLGNKTIEKTWGQTCCQDARGTSVMEQFSPRALGDRPNRHADKGRMLKFGGTRRCYAACIVALDSFLRWRPDDERPSKGVGRNHAPDGVGRRAAWREPELRYLRRGRRLPLHHAAGYTRHGNGSFVARTLSRKRIPQVHHPSPTRRPHLHLR